MTAIFIVTQLSGIAFGTYLLKRGRRKALLIGCYIACVGGLLHMVLIWPVFLAGTGIGSFGLGIMIITHARYI